MATQNTEQIPLFTEEGPEFYHAAFEHNRPWAVVGPYKTPLTITDEAAFQTWVNTWHVPFDVTANISDYDMRGYWLARVKGTSISYTVGEHFPDIWKTPYDTAFSAESIYARDGCPYHWHGEKLIDELEDVLIFWANYVPKQEKAIDLLEKSKIDPNAQTKGLMGDDLDLQNFTLYVTKQLGLRAIDQITDATLTRTIEGASTISFELNDDDRTILRSGILTQALDLQLDGLWWRLVQVGKDEGDTLTLTFETREISVLRLYTGVKVVSRNQMKRAQFVLSLIREVTAFKIPVVIPELNVTQLVEGTSPVAAQAPGKNNDGIPTDLPPADDPLDTIFDPRRSLTIRGKRPTPDQIGNVNTILGEGVDQGVRRKLLVCSIMTAIEESSITNLPGAPNLTEAGVFKHGPGQGWGRYDQITDVVWSARRFFTKAAAIDRDEPNLSYGDLCKAVQGSQADVSYAQHKPESENWVTAYTLSKPTETTAILPQTPEQPIEIINSATGASRAAVITQGSQGENYFYYRGVPGAVETKDGSTNDVKNWGPEDSWTCIRRLADEVNWRAFFVGGTFWFLDDKALFSMKPIMTITESSRGIDNISFDYDRYKKLATVTIRARIGRWLAQPGAVVVLQNMGPLNGKWLVNEFTRSLFDLDATIILKKPLPELPEPAKANIEGPPTNEAAAAAASTPSVLTACSQNASDIDKYLRSKGSPMAGSGAAFISAGVKYKVSPAFLVGIAGQESSYGQNPSATFNPFGYGPFIKFSSWADAINTVADSIANGPYYFKRKRYSALDVYLEDRWTADKGAAWSGYCSGGCNTGVLLSTISDLGGNADDVRCGADAAPKGVGCTGAQANYKNPMRSISNLSPLRVDMGVDYGGSGPLYALGDGTIDYVGIGIGWPGGVFISYTLSSGPAAGKSVFIAEHLSTNLTSANVGNSVDSSTVLATLLEGSPWMETGWAVGGADLAVAHTYYNEGDRTAHGQNFSDLLECLGAPPGTNGRTLTGTLPDGWPKWK